MVLLAFCPKDLQIVLCQVCHSMNTGRVMLMSEVAGHLNLTCCKQICLNIWNSEVVVMHKTSTSHLFMFAFACVNHLVKHLIFHFTFTQWHWYSNLM